MMKLNEVTGQGSLNREGIQIKDVRKKIFMTYMKSEGLDQAAHPLGQCTV